ncbi:unnamed protein product [Bursaphelenchus okinawaensis]|uniref:cGMP-dependent protein kinase interacting domain-containing protein n=1 Tax=Bursaphelenchus okinawaensis TaxID=465554 RepID=A0A811K879_9BILA|nr:unnamed protein product [Bursaphelenchus okinawaensis]CAG9093765.1 unnamed protein product [Bursaphelenchus okinawaensis]
MAQNRARQTTRSAVRLGRTPSLSYSKTYIGDQTAFSRHFSQTASKFDDLRDSSRIFCPRTEPQSQYYSKRPFESGANTSVLKRNSSFNVLEHGEKRQMLFGVRPPEQINIPNATNAQLSGYRRTQFMKAACRRSTSLMTQCRPKRFVSQPAVSLNIAVTESPTKLVEKENRSSGKSSYRQSSTESDGFSDMSTMSSDENATEKTELPTFATTGALPRRTNGYKSTSDKNEQSYRVLYEQKCEENDRLRKELETLKHQATHAQSGPNVQGALRRPSPGVIGATALGTTGSSTSTSSASHNKFDSTSISNSLSSLSDSTKLTDYERRQYERKISELEHELQKAKQLQSDHRRLKDENNALIRVISKLSKETNSSTRPSAPGSASTGLTVHSSS